MTTDIGFVMDLLGSHEVEGWAVITRENLDTLYAERDTLRADLARVEGERDAHLGAFVNLKDTLAYRDEILAKAADKAGSEDFKLGIRMAFDLCLFVAANHYTMSNDPAKLAEYARESDLLYDAGTDILGLTPEQTMRWKDLTEELEARRKAESALAAERLAREGAEKLNREYRLLSDRATLQARAEAAEQRAEILDSNAQSIAKRSDTWQRKCEAAEARAEALEAALRRIAESADHNWYWQLANDTLAALAQPAPGEAMDPSVRATIEEIARQRGITPEEVMTIATDIERYMMGRTPSPPPAASEAGKDDVPISRAVLMLAIDDLQSTTTTLRDALAAHDGGTDGG